MISTSKQAQNLAIKLRARSESSQRDGGHTRRATDLTDDGQIQGHWIDSFQKCAYLILQSHDFRI